MSVIQFEVSAYTEDLYNVLMDLDRLIELDKYAEDPSSSGAVRGWLFDLKNQVEKYGDLIEAYRKIKELEQIISDTKAYVKVMKEDDKG